MKNKILPILLTGLLLTSCAGESHNHLATTQKIKQIQQNNSTINNNRQENLNNIIDFVSNDIFSITDTIFSNNSEDYEIKINNIKDNNDEIGYVATIKRIDYDIVEIKLSIGYQNKSIQNESLGSILVDRNGNVDVFTLNEEGVYIPNVSNEVLNNMNNALKEIGKDNFYKSLDKELDDILKIQNKKI